jgi:hypothetical protein
MAERTSWLAIEKGWEVVAGDGAVVGRLTAVVGDEDADIFDGIRLEDGDGEERFVPADRVADITEGRIALEADLRETEAEPPGGA